MYTYTYPRPALTVDMVAVDTASNTEKVLLIMRRKAPYASWWALPGGFVEENEDLQVAALRETVEETGLVIATDHPNLRQIAAFGAPNRDPRAWTVTVVFAVEHDFSDQTVVAADDATIAEWFPLDALPEHLAFDHADILEAYQKSRFQGM
jgi:8-oxo-dGTP diphosphatase